MCAQVYFYMFPIMDGIEIPAMTTPIIQGHFFTCNCCNLGWPRLAAEQAGKNEVFVCVLLCTQIDLVGMLLLFFHMSSRGFTAIPKKVFLFNLVYASPPYYQWLCPVTQWVYYTNQDLNKSHLYWNSCWKVWAYLSFSVLDLHSVRFVG